MESIDTDTHYPYKPLLFGGFVLLGGLLIINQISTVLPIYYLYNWLDTPMHFLGGFGVGLVIIGIIRNIYTRRVYENTAQFWYTVVLVLCVGILWELVEVYFKVSILFGGLFWVDTIKDLLMDTFGGILSYICFHPRINKN